MPNPLFADIILPLAVRGKFTYLIPDEIAEDVKPGVMVTVQFGRRNLYSGIVYRLHDSKPEIKNIKPIISIYDKNPFINESQLRLWLWISEYYLC